MDDSKPVGTPSDVNVKLSVADVTDKNSLVGKVPYQEIIGSLLYLSQTTRPDIAFAVNDASRFNANHSETHWKAVKRILRYLNGTKGLKLRFTKNGPNTGLQAFTDADWGSDVDNRRSCTGYVFCMGGGAISWNSKRQATVALSSTEAEYMSISSALSEAIWIRQLHDEIVKNPLKVLILYCDNESAIKLANNDGYRPRTKHIDIRHHYIRDHVRNGDVKIDYISTKVMPADSLTKAVTKEKTQFCAKSFGLS